VSFFEYDQTKESSKPIELYKFSMGDNNWYYTSADKNITYDEIEYEAFPLKRGIIEQSPDLNRNSLKIETLRNFVIADFFKVSSPEKPILLTIIGFDRNEINEENYCILWTGRLMSCQWEELTCTFFCESLLTMFKRPALKKHYQLTCPYTLYGSACGLNKDLYKYEGIVTSINHATIEINIGSTPNDNFFNGGFLQYESPTGVPYFRYIKSQIGNTLILNQVPYDLSINDTIYCYPGCDHTMNTCKDKFDNLPNFGGFPWIPQLNPMTGDTVF